MHITLRQLKVFEAVARHLSHTRAAAELFLTQPTVSMQVAQLERQLGVPLFEQLGKRIHLTDAGREVYHYGRAITQQLEELDGVLARLKGISGGRLKVAVATTANYFMPRLLAEFTRRHPGLKASLEITNRAILLRQLGENLVDLVVMGKPPVDMELEATRFMDNPLVIIGPPDHPLARLKRVPLARLEPEIFLVRERGSGTRAAMERFFAERTMQLRTGMEVGSNEAIKRSVEAGLGLGLMSPHAVEMEVRLKRLVILPVVEFPLMRHWYLVHRRGKRLAPAAEAFKQFMLDDARAPNVRPKQARPRRKLQAQRRTPSFKAE